MSCDNIRLNHSADQNLVKVSSPDTWSEAEPNRTGMTSLNVCRDRNKGFPSLLNSHRSNIYSVKLAEAIRDR